MHKNLKTIIDNFDAALTASGYKRSRFTGSLFYEAENSLDKAFCIQATGSTISSFDERGNWQANSSWSGEWSSTVVIEVLNKLRGDGHNTDYLAKLEDENEVFRAIISSTRTGYKFFPNNITRSLTSDRTFLSTKYTITVIHRFVYGE
jgi:hypothetical protein